MSRTLFSFRLPPKPISIQYVLLSQTRALSPCLRRNLSTTIRKCAAKQKLKPPLKPSEYAPAPKPHKPPSHTPYKPFAFTLASRSEPTLLYQSASNTVYALGCYTVGLLCFAWSLHASYQIYYHPPSWFNRLLKSLYYGICGVAVSMATLFIMRPYRVIQSIQALPTASHKGARRLHLQIESARLFPGIRPRTVSVPVDTIRLSDQLYSDRSGGVPLRLLELRRKRAERVKKLGEGNFLTLPFRQLSFHLWNGWQALKGVFLNNPFIYLRANGYYGTWKLGKEAGWALDEGRAIDRIVKTRVAV